MSEYKPLLEVVAEMKEGDIADSELGWQHSIIRKDKRIYFYDKEEHLTIYFDTDLFIRKYKIRPRYVGWNKAQEALSEGKSVNFHYKGLCISFHKSTTVSFMDQPLLEKITFDDLLNGEFTILEGN